MSADLFKLLVCPETHQVLQPATPMQLEALNRWIGQGAVRTRAGQTLREPLEAGLLREDGVLLYPIRGGLPIMLADEAIPMGETGRSQ